MHARLELLILTYADRDSLYHRPPPFPCSLLNLRVSLYDCLLLSFSIYQVLTLVGIAPPAISYRSGFLLIITRLSRCAAVTHAAKPIGVPRIGGPFTLIDSATGVHTYLP